jgi:hypothetical protein
MKKIIKLFTLVVALLAISASSNAQSKFDKWPELKAFHTIMSETFHPSEEGNLEPIKTRISEMVTKAEVLAKSTVPAEFNNKDVVAAVAKLAKDSKKLSENIANKASDEAIKKALSDLHDTFHTIVEKCSKSSEHH